jgi:hypothetical protein
MWKKKLTPAVDKHQNQWELYKIYIHLENMNVTFLGTRIKSKRMIIKMWIGRMLFVSSACRDMSNPY